MLGQDIFDLVVVLGLVFFAGRGFFTGFVGEVAGLVSLVGGFWAANAFSARVTPYLDFVSDPSWRAILAYVAIFLAVILLVALIARLLQKILSFSFVSWVDKLAGGVLGLTKGLLIFSLVFLVLRKFFSQAPFFQNSRAVPYFESLIGLIRTWLPADILSLLDKIS